MEKINYLVLVNKENKLRDDWEDDLDLVNVKDYFGDTCVVEKETLAMFNKLRESLLKENIRIELDNGYRSIKRQQEIWDEFIKKYGTDYAKKYVAQPGYSEHHTGLAIDIFLIKDKEVINENEDLFKEIEIFDKIHKQIANFGFILRYPKDKEEITGYGYEPWHLRYIKDIEIANKIMSNNISLEEYLNNVNKI